MKGQPTEAFEQFGSYLNAQGESAKIKHDSDDKEGPWVGLDISDADGKFLDIKFQGPVGVAEPQWFWVYAYGDRNNRNAQEEEARAAAPAPRDNTLSRPWPSTTRRRQRSIANPTRLAIPHPHGRLGRLSDSKLGHLKSSHVFP